MDQRSRKYDQAKQKFINYLKSKSLKLTQQRLDILQIFLKSKTHVSAEELFKSLHDSHPGIGYSTVYRTLKLLKDADIAKENYFRDGFIRYESSFNRDHHDHIICIKCHEIFEFENEEIERLQEQVAAGIGFKIVDHQLEIYGVCSKCQCSPDNEENK
tara:strand:- start:933 stop:1406 length:474 start_codon:yes stop_codon:yes gene_type:complete